MVNGETDEFGNNVLFVEHHPIVELADDHTFVHDDEILQVGFVGSPVETCYPLHTRQIQRWFAR